MQQQLSSKKITYKTTSLADSLSKKTKNATNSEKTHLSHEMQHLKFG